MKRLILILFLLSGLPNLTHAHVIDTSWRVTEVVGEPWFADPSSIIGKDQEFFKGWAEGVFYECDYKGQSKIFTHYQLEEFLENKEYKNAKANKRSGIIKRMDAVAKVLAKYGEQLETDTVVSASDEFQGLREDDFRNIENRLLNNLDKHWLDKKTPADIENTSMQLPAFGKFMPDFISMSGDHLMGEGRKDAWERGGMASATEMMWRLFWDLKENQKTILRGKAYPLS